MYELLNLQPFLNFEFKLNEGERFFYQKLIELMNNVITKVFKNL